MQAHALPLAGAERALLVPDRIRDAEPAEVVDEPRAPQHLRVRQAQPRARLRDEVGDRSRVAEGVRRLEVDEVGDRESVSTDSG